MTTTERYMNERLDHLGTVAGVCQEIGLAAWLDAQDPGNRQQVSIGTATVAMLLNGLGVNPKIQWEISVQFSGHKVYSEGTRSMPSHWEGYASWRKHP
jgi:hypothetical protein